MVESLFSFTSTYPTVYSRPGAWAIGWFINQGTGCLHHGGTDGPNSETIPLKATTKGLVAGTTPIVNRHRTYPAGAVRKLVYSKEMHEKIAPARERFRKAGMSQEEDCLCSMYSSVYRPIKRF